MPAPRKTEVREAVKVLALQGKTMNAIAAEMGSTPTTVAYHCRVLIEAGEIPSGWVRRGLPPRPYNRFNKEYGVAFGRMSDLVTGMSREHMYWLIKQIPQGGTFADVLRAIVVDAYEEEKGV